MVNVVLVFLSHSLLSLDLHNRILTTSSLLRSSTKSYLKFNQKLRLIQLSIFLLLLPLLDPEKSWRDMTTITTTKPPKFTTKLHVCFSFAAYAKSLIDHLRSLNIHILPGLSEHEFTSIETAFGFTFPPDLRAILREGLPVGPHFPNWRSSSVQQIQVLLNLPSLNLTKNVTRNGFWVDSWGVRPRDANIAAKIFESFLDKASLLVLIYGNCYIPCSPASAGNPVFYLDRNIVRIQSFDISRFFQEYEFSENDTGPPSKQLNFPMKENFSTNVPPWAATSPRRVSFWSDVAENGRRVVTREESTTWWESDEVLHHGEELKDRLEEVLWKLRDGGWREEEVKEMMETDGCDRDMCARGPQINKHNVVLHVRAMSRVLLRAGWSQEDVVHMLDLHDDHEDDDHGNKSQPPKFCTIEDDHHHNKMGLKGMMQLKVS